jgi:hypothetical protein
MTPQVPQIQANRANERSPEFPRVDAFARLGVRTVCARRWSARVAGSDAPSVAVRDVLLGRRGAPGWDPGLPNGFLKTIVAKRHGDELARYAEAAGFERVEIVVDPVSAPAADEQPSAERREERPPPLLLRDTHAGGAAAR